MTVSKLQSEAVKQKPKELEWEKELLEKCYSSLKYLRDNPQLEKRDKTYLNIRNAYEKQFKAECEIIQQLLTQQRTELLNNILEENHCDLDGTYDYDGIAESVIKLCKNK